jgi:hypothetical protein
MCLKFIKCSRNLVAIMIQNLLFLIEYCRFCEKKKLEENTNRLSYTIVK